MKNNDKFCLKSGFVIPVIMLGFLMTILFNPFPTYGEEEEAEDYQPKVGRFQLDVFLGISTLNPKDLNSAVDADSKFQEFLMDDYLQHLQNQGEIESWSKTFPGDFKKVKFGVPSGFRIKYHFNKSIAVSVGLEHLVKRQHSEPGYSYTRVDNQYDSYVFDKEVGLYVLSVRAFSPFLGFHLKKSIAKHTLLEGFISGGIVIADCRYAVQHRSRWIHRDTYYNYDYTMNDYSGSVEMKGKSTGAAVEVGLRMEHSLQKHFGFFIEGSYAYRSVSNLTGSGVEVIEQTSRSWEGDWAIKQDNLEAPWGSTDVDYPTNFWEDEDSEARKQKDFKLDLSGARLKVGVFLRF
ncbi:MAG: hypothetical protein GY757_23670 [bacterium]|nr:hypothetical protein [bacterium]